LGTGISQKYTMIDGDEQYRRRSNLIPTLQEIQKTKNYLSREDLEAVSIKLGIPLSEVYGVATFYHQFELKPPGIFKISVCMGTACYLRGNTENYEMLKQLLKLKPGKKTTDDGVFTLEKTRCFGCCSLAPVIRINDDIYGAVDIKTLRRLIAKYRSRAKQIQAKARERRIR